MVSPLQQALAWIRRLPQHLPGRKVRLPATWQAPPMTVDDALQAVAAKVLEAHNQGQLTDVDAVRIGAAIRDTAADRAEVAKLLLMLDEFGAAAFCHSSGQRDLPNRVARHHLAHGKVRIGTATVDRRNLETLAGREVGLEMAMLRTSMLVIGPPGSGKTHSLARPVVEHLCLQALAGQASAVVIDIKGDDFAGNGVYDIDLTLGHRGRADAYGFDLYGGAATPDEAADRLASALLPPSASGDKAYFSDAAKNALYGALACYHAANDRYPPLYDLLGLLRETPSIMQSVRDRLTNKGLYKDYERLLGARAEQRSRREDPAASVVERLSLLDRPAIVDMLDTRQRRFSMPMINQPVRVRLAFPEAQFPDATRTLTRLALAQFVQTAGAPTANTGIFKGLVLDEASRYIDDYVALGAQRLRSRNAGLMLLTQSLADLPVDLRDPIFGSANCKAVFGGVNPVDARYLADYWGTEWVDDSTQTRSFSHGTSASSSGTARSTSDTGHTTFTYAGDTEGHSSNRGESTTVRQVERHRWSPSDIINQIPAGHGVLSLARPDGVRIPPILVNFRV
ncbi:TraM recognition domain-containing protein (plasmid) [Saccharothrix sp. AJ9571]|nr:TraM recognition domain-containing protein [Saccharothrix sp. AJ9571]